MLMQSTKCYEQLGIIWTNCLQATGSMRKARSRTTNEVKGISEDGHLCMNVLRTTPYGLHWGDTWMVASTGQVRAHSSPPMACIGKGGRQREFRCLASRWGSGGLVAGVYVQSTRRSGHSDLFYFFYPCPSSLAICLCCLSLSSSGHDSLVSPGQSQACACAWVVVGSEQYICQITTRTEFRSKDVMCTDPCTPVAVRRDLVCCIRPEVRSGDTEKNGTQADAIHLLDNGPGSGQSTLAGLKQCQNESRQGWRDGIDAPTCPLWTRHTTTRRNKTKRREEMSEWSGPLGSMHGLRGANLTSVEEKNVCVP